MPIVRGRDVPMHALRRGDIIEGVGLGTSTIRPSADFETYSEAGYIIDTLTGKVKSAAEGKTGGLPLVGTPAYVEHPSTEPPCMAYDLKDGLGVRIWVPGTPNPSDLLSHVYNGGELEAHNIPFELQVWNGVCVPRYDWPELRLEQCYCVMARSRRFSLPGKLGKIAEVLGTTPKDPDGTRLIGKLSRPHTPTKARPAIRWTPVTAWDDYYRFYQYCMQDVKAEDEIAARIPDLNPYEREVWLVDQQINRRGVQVDMEALNACSRLLDELFRIHTAELRDLTDKSVQTVGQTEEIRAWLAGRGVSMPNVQAETVVDALAQLPPGSPEAEVLSIRQLLAGSNVKKLKTLMLQVSRDGRLRDQYIYAGAPQTKRWSSGGVQLQNLTSKGPKCQTCPDCGEYIGITAPGCPACGVWINSDCKEEDWGVEAVECALDHIKHLPYAQVREIWGDPGLLLAGCLRGLFVAKPGHELICCDFSAIEAVVAACISGCQWRIDVFMGDGLIYETSAAKATGIPLEDILRHKKTTGQHHPARKKQGKVRELAGGYGGWIGAWKNFGADEFMTDAEIKDDVLKWRAESPEFPEMWGGQYKWCGPGRRDYKYELHGLEGAAIQAILNPGQCFHYNDISYGVHDDALYCRLPSGNTLQYHTPRLETVQDKLGRGPSYQITFWGYNTNPAKGATGWVCMETYGGRLFENVVQAIAAELQALAMLRVAKAGFDIVMHTHDEITVEVKQGLWSVPEIVELMVQREDWCAWWPIKAAGWIHKRFQK